MLTAWIYVLHNLRLRLKKYEVSAQREQCEWFMLPTTGPRLTGMLLATSRKTNAGSSVASWELLK